MVGDEIPAHDAIAVQEYAIGAARGQDRSVANFGGAKTPIFVPDMLQMLSDLDLALPAFDHTGCGRARSVIGYYNLKIPVGLAPKRPQHRFECIFAVVGSHDDGK